MRSPFFRKLPGCLLGAVIAAGVAHTAIVHAVDGNPPGLFELDGNIPDDPAKTGDDWGGLYDGSAVKANLIAFTGVLSDPAPKSIFTQGGSKDVNDVPDWKYTDGSVPDKDDITNAYAAAYTNPADVCFTNGAPSTCTTGQTPVHKANDLIVYFGFDRLANNGDAFAGFWFFQSDVSLGANGAFNGKHTAMRPDPNNPGKYLPGDMFVTVTYPQASGAVPSIKVYEWDPNDVNGDKNVDPDLSGGKMSPLQLLASSTDATCDGKGNKLACAITNLGQQDSPPWPYTPKSGTGLPFESFFEGGINVTRLLGSTPCFASFLAETRSSSSQTAQLKDFVVGAFPVCGIDVTKACAGALNKTGDGVNVTFFGTLTNTGGSSYVAYLKDSQAGAAIDHVCVDTGTPGCADNTDVSGLVKNADGSAYFTMTSKQIVRYEGHYDISGLPPAAPSGKFQLNDTMTAQGFAKAADITDPKLAIVTDTATAGCNYAVTPKLEVVKDCAVAFLNGDHADVTISGTVKNAGDTPLSSVTLSDSDFGSLTIDSTIAAGVTKNYSKTVTVPYANLNPAVSAPDANGVVTVTLNHADTVTASGKVLASDGSTLATAEKSDDATCNTTFTRGIGIQKDCDKVLLEPDANGHLVVKVQVTATVSNTGTENLSVTSLTDNPAVVFDKTTFALPAGGAPVVVNGYYYPTSGSNILGLTNLKFPDTATVSATGAFSGATATGSDDASCPLCPVP